MVDLAQYTLFVVHDVIWGAFHADLIVDTISTVEQNLDVWVVERII